MPTARQLELLKLIVTDRGISECLPTFFFRVDDVSRGG